MNGTVTIPKHLSFSAMSSYADCGERYKLERMHLNNGTWFATVAGGVIHGMIQRKLLGEDVKADEFEELFKSAIQGQLDRGVELKASGRKNKEVSFSGGPNKRDHGWWSEFGPQIYEAFIRWIEEHDELEVLRNVDGDPIGVELEFNIELGEVPVKGFVDAVFVNNETGQLFCVDWKTGSAPKGALQLDTYALALEKVLGVLPDWAGFCYPYWSKTNGRVEVNVPDWHYTGTVSEDYMDYLYRQSRRGIEEGIFLPSPSNLCAGCGVRDFCRAQDGVFSQEVSIHPEIKVYDSQVEIESTEEETE